jgi:putative NIF3 family GTP cyclohydrolase 1 type 2
VGFAAVGGAAEGIAAAGVAAEGITTAGIAGYGDFELLHEDGHLPDGTAFSYGRVGYLDSPRPLLEYLDMLKKTLGTNGLRYYDAGRDVYKVGVVGGSGGSQRNHAVSCGCDTFVTADVKYDLFLEAKERGINLIDGDHFCTENLVTGVLVSKLRTAFPEAEATVSKSHNQTARFF